MREASQSAPLAELVGAGARYGEGLPLAVDDVTLSVRPGEVVALLGANGAGKSTLLRLVAGLVRPSAGHVRIGGAEVSTLQRRELARILAFVPQTERVAEGFQVRQVVAMGRAPHQDGWMVSRPEDLRAVDEVLARCDLTALAGRNVETLSGGEHRRVAIARALAQKPRLLVLDEPAAFLDVRHRLELHELLADVAKRDGVACVVAMHDLDAAARIASRVVLLRGGKVVAQGAPDEVLTPPRLAETFEVDVEVAVHAATGTRTFVAVRAR